MKTVQRIKAFVMENKSVKSVQICVLKNRYTMSEIVNQSLQKIAKGTGIVFIGTIIGMLLKKFIYNIGV